MRFFQFEWRAFTGNLAVHIVNCPLSTAPIASIGGLSIVNSKGL
jgi:hypothetical protein